MTRFARARGSKASNEKTPEDSTPWEVMKEQLLQSKKESEDAKNRQEAENKRIENYENFLKEQKVQKRKATWCDFPETQSVTKNTTSNEQQQAKKKKNKQKKSYNGTVEFGNDTVKIQTESKEETTQLEKKKNKNESNEMTSQEGAINPSEDSGPPKKKKKNKKLTSEYQGNTNQNVVPNTGSKPSTDDTQTPVKNKNAKTSQEGAIISSTDGSPPKKKKKKNKKLNTETDQAKYSQDVVLNADSKATTDNTETPVKKKKKKKNKKNKKANGNPINPENQTNGTTTPKKNKEINPAIANKNNKIKAIIKKKDKPLVDGKPVRRKEVTERSFQLIINGKDIELVRYDGFPIMKKDAERIEELKNSMIKKGIPKSEVQRTIKLERRRAEKALARLKRDVCYNCRKGGHNLSDCPELKSKIPGVDAAEGVCFKCGSTEHRQFECKVQRDKEFRFATCFICKESGHIARQCPDNPKGLYPNGGCCKLCGDVTHLRKDCPTINDKKESSSVKISTLANTDNIEDLGQQPQATFSEGSSKKPKKIKF